MSGERILVIEDEPDLVRIYEALLKEAGYRILAADNGQTGLALAYAECPDLILLDLMMPGIHGLEVCRALRRTPQTQTTPLIVVTACASESDTIAGLDAGADDYLVKPFKLDEVLARVRAQLRRAAQNRLAYRQTGPAIDVQINEHTLGACVNGRMITLTLCQHQLLSFLIHNQGIAFSSEQLLRRVWGYTPENADVGLVRWHMGKLRAKIEPDPQRPQIIQTIRNRGYIYQPNP
jgi:DNA-binding response OmpR family regulator